METDAHARALLNTSSRVPSKGALPLGPPHAVPSERDSYSPPSFIFRSPQYMTTPPPRFRVPLGHKGAPMERDAHIQSLS